MPSHTFEVTSFLYVCVALLCALCVLIDIYLVGRQQPMTIMNAVWPLTMLYWGPVGLIAYFWFGRGEPSKKHPPHAAHAKEMHMHHHEKPMWQACFTGASHCGAGCALGDFAGDWIAFLTGATLFGTAFGATLALAFAMAYLFGILFQYFSVAPMKNLGVKDGLIAAIKIDTVSLLFYEVGMFAWMIVRLWLFPDLEPTHWSYWFMMQVAMMIGFMTTYPINWWLIKRGVKEKM